MTALRDSILFLVFTLLVGCASGPWKAENIPFPRTTPFDSNGFARTAYLDGFERGYRAEMSGESASADLLTGPHGDTKRQGFHAGVAHARAEKAGASQNKINDDTRSSPAKK
jgi:hypothetical protein